MRQQLDSFDEFIMNTMQEIVDECAELHLVPQQQHNPLMQASGGRSYKITFGQIYLSKPTWVEPDQTTSAMFPNEARLRNLTYAAPLYMDLKRSTINVDADGNEEDEEEDFPKVFLGQVCCARFYATRDAHTLATAAAAAAAFQLRSSFDAGGAVAPCDRKPACAIERGGITQRAAR